jgi:RNA 3'-terminal phosphate cyclase (ATP)
MREDDRYIEHVIEIDGSQYSGSGTIVRQAIMLSALTGQAVHIVNARAKRPKPGLRPQHIRVVEAIRELVNGSAEGLSTGSREVLFRPGTLKGGRRYHWDIGSAGSTTNLALAVLPVLAFAPDATQVELRGGLFQDFAPSFYHLQHVVLPLLGRMGLEAEVVMGRPGYVPRGDGVLRLHVKPVRQTLRGVVLEDFKPVERVWGIAMASHLEERRVSHRMAASASEILASVGYKADIEVRDDTSSLQPGAALAAFADLAGGVRLGADRAGAPGRTSEAIGRYVARRLLEDLKAGATVDRYAADQIIPFAALAEGESRFRIPAVTEHVETNAWMVKTFLGVQVTTQDHRLALTGAGFRRTRG